jgi:Flp pilus assembly protein TadG
MRRLTVGRHAERGAVAVIVAAMFGSFALLGCVALTVDVGTMSLERRQIQNGADAAASSAVLDCATTAACPDVTNPADPKMARLRGLANGNAADAATAVSRIDGQLAVCGAGKAELRPCAAVSGSQLRDCPAVAAPPTQFVRVYTQTSRPGGGNTLLPSAFAEAITGSAAGTRHQACAAYAWGAPATFSITSPLAISLCDYQAMITTTSYADPPPYASPIPSAVTSHEVAVVVNDPSQFTDSNGCARWAGHVLPGGFGYLDPDGGCSPTVSAGDWVHGKPGNSVPNPCKPSLDPIFAAPVNARPVLLIPVFDCVSDSTKVCPKATSGADTWYHVKGLAAFSITGSNMPSYTYAPQKASTICASGKKCLYGWFTEAVLRNTTAIGPGPGFGVNVIRAVG